MKRDWLELCRKVSVSPASYWSGGKKIIRHVRHRFPDPTGPLTLEEVGYTKTKMSLLVNSYIHEESLSAAVIQWNDRKNYKSKAHWSTGFHCYNHILKGHSKAETGIGSTMGPCLQSIILTHTVEGLAEVDVFYRTTEVFKKFPADLILIRDHILTRFDFDRTPLSGMNIHAVNMTVSPTYAPTMLMLDKDPLKTLEDIRQQDPNFHRVVSRWCFKLIRGPDSKFNQARRTQKAVQRLMSDERQDDLVAYFHRHYPEVTA